jgi:hypothetical protein
MTKLEQKLIELGYEERHFIFDLEKYYFKYNYAVDYKIEDWYFRIHLNSDKTKINYACVEISGDDNYIQFYSQEQIDNLQQAFNQLQNDLKELKTYE